MSDIPVNVRKWVLKDGEQPAEITEPIYYSHYAAAELYPYMPQEIRNTDTGGNNAVASQASNLTPRSYKMAHQWDAENKLIYINVVNSGNSWSDQLSKVMSTLRFEVSAEHGHPCLMATRASLVDLSHVPDTNFGVWNVVGWTVYANINSSGIGIHQDVIVFRDSNGLEAEASMAWLPYAA